MAANAGLRESAWLEAADSQLCLALLMQPSLLFLKKYFPFLEALSWRWGVVRSVMSACGRVPSFPWVAAALRACRWPGGGCGFSLLFGGLSTFCCGQYLVSRAS